MTGKEYCQRAMKEQRKYRKLYKSCIPQWSIAYPFIAEFLGEDKVTYEEFYDRRFESFVAVRLGNQYAKDLLRKFRENKSMFTEYAEGYNARNKYEVVENALFLLASLREDLAAEAIDHYESQLETW